MRTTIEEYFQGESWRVRVTASIEEPVIGTIIYSEAAPERVKGIPQRTERITVENFRDQDRRGRYIDFESEKDVDELIEVLQRGKAWLAEQRELGERVQGGETVTRRTHFQEHGASAESFIKQYDLSRIYTAITRLAYDQDEPLTAELVHRLSDEYLLSTKGLGQKSLALLRARTRAVKEGGEQ